MAGSNSESGDPIDLRTGNVFHTETDIELASGLKFQRHYNSKDSIYKTDNKPAINYMLGNWRADFLTPSGTVNIKLSYGPVDNVSGIGNVTASVYRANGVVLEYRSRQHDASNRFVAPWTSATTEYELGTLQGETGSWTGLSFNLRDGTEERYDTSGYLTEIRDQFGVWVTLVRSGGQLLTAKDRFGNVLEFEYDLYGDVQSLDRVLLNGNEIVTYTYSTQGYLKKAQYTGGGFREYFYDDSSFPMALTRIRNELGQDTNTWTYDSNRRANSSAEAPGVMNITLDYLHEWVLQTPSPDIKPWYWLGNWLYAPPPEPVFQSAQSQESVVETFPSGLQNTYVMTNAGGVLGTAEKSRAMGTQTAEFDTEYDAAGNIIQTTDWRGNVTTFTYDELGRELTRTEGVGTSAERTTTREWHTTLNLPTRITTPATDTVYTYTGNKIDTRTETDLTSWNAGSRTWTYSYTPEGLLASVDGPLPGNADITTYTWTQRDDLPEPKVIGGRLLSVTNALGHVTQITAHNALGLPTTIIDANGIATHLAYNARGWLTSSTRVDPQAGNLVTSYTRDNAGNITRITLPGGAITDFEYNAVGDVVSIEDAIGASIEYTRDGERNITTIETYHSSGSLVGTLSQAHNGLKQLTALTGASIGIDAVNEYDANGNPTRNENGLGHGTNHVYDALDRVVRSTDAIGAQTQYTYDAEGNLASVTDARQLQTTYAYDGLGCLRSQSSPDTGVTVFCCDAAGNVISKTDARGITTTLTYDALGRLTGRGHLVGEVTVETATFTYDNTDNNHKGIGLLTASSNASANSTYQYDARGNLVSEARTINNIAFTTAYGYDTADRLIGMTYPSGRTVTYTRDAAGQITGVTTSASSTDTQVLASNILWAPFGPLETLTYGNGLVETRDYDYSGFLTRLDIGTHIQRQYSRDAAGRIVSVDANVLTLTGGIQNNIESFEYTDADRVSKATAVNVIPPAPNAPVQEPTLEDIYKPRYYTYDSVGNRVQGNRANATTNYTYANDSNRLLGSSGQEVLSITYDAVGNPVTYGDMQFTWNAANRLKTAVVPGNNGNKTFNYKYNAHGERVWKDGPNSSTIFHYDANGRLIAETSGSGVLQREYIWLGDKPLALVSKPNAGGAFQYYYVHSDHIDTALMLTDSAQAISWNYTRDAFGGLTTGSNTVKWLLRFPGQYYDGETGLFYNYFRDYDPQTGRYIESDPIGLRGGINTYAYVGGNPVSNVDAFGLMGRAPGRGQPTTTTFGVFGCFGMCVGYDPGASKTRPQASLEPTLGGGIQMCTGPTPSKKSDDQCSVKKSDCGMFDPNCDNKWSPPSISPIPEKTGGFMISFGVKPDGRICINFGPHMGAPAPGFEMGDFYERYER